VSRDVVFDESVYPFAQLHQNAGARLRAELDLLHDILKNPSHDFGDAIVHDQCLISTDPANVALSSSGGSLSPGKKRHQMVQKLRRTGHISCVPPALRYTTTTAQESVLIRLLLVLRRRQDLLWDRCRILPPLHPSPTPCQLLLHHRGALDPLRLRPDRLRRHLSPNHLRKHPQLLLRRMMLQQRLPLLAPQLIMNLMLSTWERQRHHQGICLLGLLCLSMCPRSPILRTGMTHVFSEGL